MGSIVSISFCVYLILLAARFFVELEGGVSCQSAGKSNKIFSEWTESKGDVSMQKEKEMNTMFYDSKGASAAANIGAAAAIHSPERYASHAGR